MAIKLTNPDVLEVQEIQIAVPVEGELRPNGTSAHIQVASGVTTERLAAFGFFTASNRFFYMKDLGCGVSFNLSIDKETLSDVKIDVLDDDFGQPYDYQAILIEGHDNWFAKVIYEKVEKELAELQESHILTGHVRGDYV